MSNGLILTMKIMIFDVLVEFSCVYSLLEDVIGAGICVSFCLYHLSFGAILLIIQAENI